MLEEEGINERIRYCNACALSDSRRVYGDVNRSRILFIGEAPGQDERRIGLPFVGDAGQVLDSWIRECGFTRKQVAIINAVKCMKEKNRKPAIDEIDACNIFLWDQIYMLKPSKIVVLGASAMYSVLRTQMPVMENVGRIFKVVRDDLEFELLIMPHPAYCLRNLTYKPPIDIMKRFLK